MQPGGALGAFDGLRVLEIAEGVAGPVCGLQLADLGADVVKIEPPDGDRAREWGPPMLGDTAAIFVHLNRGKRSVVLDLFAPDGRARLDRLLDTADVVVLHLDPADRAALAPDWVGILRRRPKLVAVEIDDLGPIGPMAALPGSELVVQGLSGLTRYLGEVGGEPVRVGFEIAGMAAGMHAFQAAAAALYHVRAGGDGQHVRVTALKALLSLKAILLAAQDEPDRWEGFHLHGPTWPADTGKQTRDGQVTTDFRVAQRDAWAAFCRQVGLGHLVDDPDFADWRSTLYIGDRWHSTGRVYDPWFASKTSAEASAAINDLGDISVKFHDYAELLSHPQIAALDPLLAVDDPAAPQQLGSPFRLHGHDLGAARRAPALGEHTDDVLGTVPA